MKKLVSLLLSLLMIISIFTSVPVTVSAASEDYLYFELNEDGESYSVTFCDQSASGEIIIPDTYNDLPVIAIKKESFYYCRALTSVIIPESVTSIGEYAFYNCDKLEQAIIPDSVTDMGGYVFCGCDELASVTIGNGISNIGKYAFGVCDKLTSITIGSSVKRIDNYAFYDTKNISSVNITDLVAWCNINFGESYANPLRFGATLYINGELPSILEIPDGITTIPDYTFSNNSNLTSIIFPDSVTHIGECAFRYCTSLTTLTIGNGVKNIANGAFANCYDLVSVTIPPSVTHMDSGAFNGCYDLTSVYITDLLAWCNIDFADEDPGLAFFFGTFYINGELPSIVEIPEGATQIPNNTFNHNTNLTSVTIPDTVTKIGNYAFAYCTNLENVTIPDSVEDIGYCAFRYCDGLTSVTIPDSVTNIDFGAFEHSKNLKNVKIGSGATDIADDVFYVCENLVEIEVSEDNNSYSSLDGVWYNKDKTKLIFYPEGKEQTAFTIPDTVEAFGQYAFYDANLDTIIFGRGNSEIPDSLFFNCFSLASLVIPLNITYIGYSVFANCYSLEDVYYEGTQEQWNNMTIQSQLNGNLTKVNIHYNVNPANWKDHYGEPAIIKEATCVRLGSATISCACGYEKTEVFENWDNHISAVWDVEEKATVYSAGEKVKKCTECGEVLKTAIIKQLKCSKPVLKKVYNANDYVKVTWGTVKGADLYRVYRKTGTGEYEYIGSTTHTYFNDKEAGAGKTCRYIVKAKNEAGNSDASASIAIKHIDEPTLKSIENSAYGVLIKWDKVTGAEKYNVYRKVSGGEYEYIGATSNTYYTDRTAKSGTKYYYAIRGKRDDSVSSQSASLSKYYLEDPTLNTPTSTSKGIGLRWSEVAGAEGYMVYRRTTNGSYKIISTEKGVSNLTYRDTTAEKGTKYYYKVKAYKSKTYSAYSNTKAITDKY